MAGRTGMIRGEQTREREQHRASARPRSARAGRVWGKRRGMRGRTETGRTGTPSEQAQWNPGKRRTVWYVRYVRYGTLWQYSTTVRPTVRTRQTAIGPTIPRRPFSVRGQAGHLDAFRVPRLWAGWPFLADVDLGNRLGCRSPTAIPASPRGTESRYIHTD